MDGVDLECMHGANQRCMKGDLRSKVHEWRSQIKMHEWSRSRLLG